MFESFQTIQEAITVSPLKNVDCSAPSEHFSFSSLIKKTACDAIIKLSLKPLKKKNNRAAELKIFACENMCTTLVLLIHIS